MGGTKRAPIEGFVWSQLGKNQGEREGFRNTSDGRLAGVAPIAWGGFNLDHEGARGGLLLKRGWEGGGGERER